ncbi:MAG: N-6 DNA methylase [Bacteroidetes bacterium]|nr:N-6 DNA methylase [Bacteroidota bacterium]
MTIPEYLIAIDALFRSGRATEHSYRGDLQQLLASLCKGISVTNEPVRIACGAPDYILTRQQIPVGYIEAKDIGVDLGSKGLKEQFDRYKASLENLIITDYLEFRFFRGGEPTTSIRIAEVSGGKVKSLAENFGKFTALITDFAAWQGQTITSAKKLAGMMAGKARLLADVIEQAVESDEQSQQNTDLRQQLEAFKVILIHDITPKAFADLYAQTIAYGMFAARLHDPSPGSFTREEAAKLIPKSNPFLRKLFNSISGNDLDTRIEWIVDALADIFRATDIAKLLGGFGKGSGREDAFMHFYEDFLAQYDPKLRKSRGVWYTPDAVVRFIVRAVDDILKSEFGLPMGLADASTTQIEVDTDNTDNRTTTGKRRVKKTVHRVQVLDPATGTGTFLAEVVRQVHAKLQGQQGTWPQYVEQHLIPRLNGFELLMASYAMAHLKLDLVLRDTGYDMGQPHGTPNARYRSLTTNNGQPTTDNRQLTTDQQRLRIFLTNSLEEAHPDTGTLFASWLSQEANEANAVKRDTPVMVVLGNPPYAVGSSNKGKWIQDELITYKAGLNEKKLNLDDDYITICYIA